MPSMTMQKWSSKPFCSKVPGKRFKQSYECHPCAFCGSVVVLGGNCLAQSKKYERVFCDIQCAGEYKKSHNRTVEYRQKTNITSLLPHEADKIRKTVSSHTVQDVIA